MKNKIKLINLYLLDKDNFINNGFHMISNKSILNNILIFIFKYLSIYLIKYNGSIRRTNTFIIENNELIKIDALIVTYFESDKCNYFNLKILNGFLRESDCIYNDDFENKINILYNLICKNNSYTDYEYKIFINKLKSKLKK